MALCDISTLRSRNNALVQSIKLRIGLQDFENLKMMSHRFQHDLMGVHDYYHAARCMLQDDSSLIVAMANLLPDHAQREALLQTHLNQPQGSALAPGKPKSYYAGSDAATPPPLPGVLVQRERAQRGSRGMRAGAGPEVLVLQEGLVWIKRWMSRETQQWLVDETMRLGDGEEGVGGGFYKADGNMMKLNSGNKGRVIAPIGDFPARYSEECAAVLAQATSVDPTMPQMNPDVVLVNFYHQKSSLGWHRDNDAGKAFTEMNLGKPVVSFSIGDAADFGYKWRFEDQEQIIKLESGDAIIFGGPSRMILHSILKVHPNTKPRALRMRQGRLNITFRDHSELEAHEIDLGYDGDNRLKRVQDAPQ
mmetsp:Transcript_9780/g.18433  ORF Transcript_9780/g.18433 Transcript_9780/m.18433 type:complete len:363 (-) Transcript_9780:413-1501(-)|eukprot:CAMPEP_0114238412 /NCGR_PEP_ID=MMETSP0058-20121206/7911_1 /TAXON_ID=36894 /ORGANISM="Pyramimonas parkeae, CCMP726" /LENGTH=362 /DNA_ID=CAMNT_0001350521 /DNA_START=154 /DNA_END=1242 /DNA_ORIENTATION=-